MDICSVEEQNVHPVLMVCRSSQSWFEMFFLTFFLQNHLNLVYSFWP